MITEPDSYNPEKHCIRCGGNWAPRKPGRPALCPKCGTAKWDVPIAKNEPGAKRIHINKGVGING